MTTINGKTIGRKITVKPSTKQEGKKRNLSFFYRFFPPPILFFPPAYGSFYFSIYFLINRLFSLFFWLFLLATLSCRICCSVCESDGSTSALLPFHLKKSAVKRKKQLSWVIYFYCVFKEVFICIIDRSCW